MNIIGREFPIYCRCTHNESLCTYNFNCCFNTKWITQQWKITRLHSTSREKSTYIHWLEELMPLCWPFTHEWGKMNFTLKIIYKIIVASGIQLLTNFMCRKRASTLISLPEFELESFTRLVAALQFNLCLLKNRQWSG